MFTPHHVSHVICHMSRVTCQVSREASRWRVCYQRGLPRLVITLSAFSSLQDTEEVVFLVFVVIFLSCQRIIFMFYIKSRILLFCMIFNLLIGIQPSKYNNLHTSMTIFLLCMFTVLGRFVVV